MLVVDVLCVYLSFYPTHSCEITFCVDIVHLMSTSRVLSGITCIISRNLRNVAPSSGLGKKSAYISPIRHYFRDNSPFSIRYLIKKFLARICFFCFVIYYLLLFSIIIALMLSWWNSIPSTTHPCPSMRYINHRQCVKSSSAPTVSF